MEELTGKLVLVHPQLTQDPVSRQGQIGVIATTDLERDVITVGFGGGPLGRYSADALLILKDKKELYQEIMTGVQQMDSATFKYLLEINMNQERPHYEQISAAMKIAAQNPEVLDRSMVSLEDFISKSQNINASQQASFER